VKRDVLKIDYEIEGDGADNDRGPWGQVIEIDEPPTLLPGKNGYSYRDDREDAPDHDRVQNMDREIIEPPEHLRRSQVAARRYLLKYEHANENGRKESDPDGDFISDCICE
jgi:hypothetical protein